MNGTRDPRTPRISRTGMRPPDPGERPKGYSEAPPKTPPPDWMNDPSLLPKRPPRKGGR